MEFRVNINGPPNTRSSTAGIAKIGDMSFCITKLKGCPVINLFKLANTPAQTKPTVVTYK